MTYCWFARDITAAMLVGKNKSISLIWGNKLHFYVNSSRKNSVILTTSMAVLSDGCEPRMPCYWGREKSLPFTLITETMENIISCNHNDDDDNTYYTHNRNLSRVSMNVFLRVSFPDLVLCISRH